MKIRVLQGELEEAVDMGIRVLKIVGVLHLNKLMLITMPSLIQIMVLFKIHLRISCVIHANLNLNNTKIQN